jgi:hypothetical protein
LLVTKMGAISLSFSSSLDMRYEILQDYEINSATMHGIISVQYSNDS